jgi:tritrans,polycis-undecaprenyl-diphosphate synthase [geranylgeranyl-diphosphate specific]
MKNSPLKTFIKNILLIPAYRAYQIKLETDIKRGPIPRCIGVIMDGNRRWAMGEGRLPWEGHREGKAKVREFLEWCTEIGIRSVVLYSFSTENFKRKKEEVDELMNLFKQGFRELSSDPTIMEKGVRIKLIGKRELLPQDVLKEIQLVEEKTAKNKNYDLAFAIAYGGREEILHACRTIAESVREGKVEINRIDEELFRKHLYTSDIPDPDMIIRTSGEQRLSGFLPWQTTYSELFFVDVHWPAFRKIDFLRLIRSFQQRERRIGS